MTSYLNSNSHLSPKTTTSFRLARNIEAQIQKFFGKRNNKQSSGFKVSRAVAQETFYNPYAHQFPKNANSKKKAESKFENSYLLSKVRFL